MSRAGTQDRQQVARRGLLAVVGAALLLVALAPAPARAQPLLDASVAYLQSAQNADGGFGGAVGQPSDPLFTSWAALGLSAAGINPNDQKTPGGDDALAYLRTHQQSLSATTDFERTLLVVAAAGDDGRDFGGHDLVGTILGRRLADGSFPYAAGGQKGAVNATAFAVLALAGIKDESLGEIVSRAADWLQAKQNADGGYGFNPGLESDVDMTAAVVQALRAAGQAGTAAEQKALAFMDSAQNGDGGFADVLGKPSNTSSTAWGVQGLWAAEVDPASWNKGGHTPLDFIASMQQADGSVRQSASSDANRIWVTAYALPAMAGRALPIAAVPRSDPDPKPDANATGDPVAEAATGDKSSAGVTSGGGGKGAKLFTRPRAGGQSHRNSRPKSELPASVATGAPAVDAQTAAAVEQAGRSRSGPGTDAGGVPVTGLPLSAQTIGDTGETASGFRTAVDGGAELTLLIALGLVALVVAGSLIEARPAR